MEPTLSVMNAVDSLTAGIRFQAGLWLRCFRPTKAHYSSTPRAKLLHDAGKTVTVSGSLIYAISIIFFSSFATKPYSKICKRSQR